MNILIFTAIYPAPEEYGISRDTKVVHYYAKQWEKAGHNVQVVYLHLIPVKKINFSNFKKRKGFESDYEYDGIKVHLLEYQLLFPKSNYLSKFQAKVAEKQLAKFIKQSFISDKVFVHFPCSFKGIKCVSDFSCPTMAVLHNIDVKILKKHKKLFSEIDKYSNLGGRNKKICDTISSILSRDSSLVLSGIDEVLIPSFEQIEKKLIEPSSFVKIVYAGNLIKLKKVDIIIKALELVNFDYQLEIIGDGPEKDKLKSLAKDNPKIIFRGRMSREDTIEKMRQADVFVMVSSPETFGLVYLEAMAQGCITVGSKNEGIDGVIIDGQNGFLVPAGNVGELAKCFNKINSMNFEQKQKLVCRAYKDAIDMTDFNMATKYLDLNK